MSYHVCYDQDRVVCALVFRIGEVCRDCGLFLASICICEGKGEGRVGAVLSPIFLISPTAVPSCLTPTVQHAAGGWEVIFLGYQGS
jgi:hypothetical protein